MRKLWPLCTHQTSDGLMNAVDIGNSCATLTSTAAEKKTCYGFAKTINLCEGEGRRQHNQKPLQNAKYVCMWLRVAIYVYVCEVMYGCVLV